MGIPDRSANLSHLGASRRLVAGPFVFALITNPLAKGVKMIVNTCFAGEVFSNIGESFMVIFAGPPTGQPSHSSSHHAASSRD
jgi:hypothetical protein